MDYMKLEITGPPKDKVKHLIGAKREIEREREPCVLGKSIQTTGKKQKLT